MGKQEIPMKSLALAKTVLLFAAALAMPLVWGCAGPLLPESGSDGVYRLDSGDQLRIIVFGQEELTGSYVVDGAGAISVPLIPPVDVRGLTTVQLEQKIGEYLKKGVVISPSVSVQIEILRPFFILGEVRRPGQYPYVHEMTVLTAVAIAGGFTPRADENGISITRSSGDTAIEARVERHTRVQPGDVVFVHERFF